MILSRPVNPRARRTHDIVASVPLFTIRTFSIDGTHAQISSAISTSNGLGIPKLTPRDAVLAQRLHHDGRRMAKNRRTPCAHVVDQLTAIDIPDVRTRRALDEEWLALDTAESAHWGIYAAGDAATGGGEKLGRTRCHGRQPTLSRQRRASTAEALAGCLH